MQLIELKDPNEMKYFKCKIPSNCGLAKFEIIDPEKSLHKNLKIWFTVRDSMDHVLTNIAAEFTFLFPSVYIHIWFEEFLNQDAFLHIYFQGKVPNLSFFCSKCCSYVQK